MFSRKAIAMCVARTSVVLTVLLLSCARAKDPAPVAVGIAGPENATVTGELGQPVIVRCRAFGYPAPTVIWRRGNGGAVIPYSSALYETHGLELHIRLMTIETLGVYECQAYNGVGDAATWRVAVRAYRPQSRYLVDREMTETSRPTTPATDAPHNATLQPDLETIFSTAACSLYFRRGPCKNFTVTWFYDTVYGGCSRFWYGGCEGNGNRFSSKMECEATCVSPPPKVACRLPQIKGACLGNNERWYYDTEREMCSSFIYGGCLGNANNFKSRELCQAQCEPEVILG